MYNVFFLIKVYWYFVQNNINTYEHTRLNDLNIMNNNEGTFLSVKQSLEQPVY